MARHPTGALVCARSRSRSRILSSCDSLGSWRRSPCRAPSAAEARPRRSGARSPRRRRHRPSVSAVHRCVAPTAPRTSTATSSSTRSAARTIEPACAAHDRPSVRAVARRCAAATTRRSRARARPIDSASRSKGTARVVHRSDRPPLGSPAVLLVVTTTSIAPSRTIAARTRSHTDHVTRSRGSPSAPRRARGSRGNIGTPPSARRAGRPPRGHPPRRPPRAA